MPRNTFLLVAILAIFAALVTGVNLTRPNQPSVTQQSNNLTITPTPTPTPAPALIHSENQYCGIAFDYPDTYLPLEGPANSVVLTSKTSADTIIVACQKDIPRPPVAAERIETLTIASISAKLYHDTSAKDGTPMDKLIFTHPKTGLDVFISGLGMPFQQVIASVKFL